MLEIGSLLDHKYKILNEVGHGGMSVVYLAINEVANKMWAVKEVRKDGVCDFEAVKQGLIVETDMLKKLDHPYLPSIIDVIEKDDSFLIVMDYIQGKSLKDVLKNGGAQPKEEVIKWGIQLCDVLGYLHSRQPSIIYRDMKPANVMLKPDGNITLIDFGTAREFKNRNMVEDTTCLGTRGYAAPEQFGGRGQTDPRTDIYCLGATLYHLITGHSPAEPPYEIKPLRYWNPAFTDSGLEMIINKCCQQDPGQRYQSCAELRYDLENEEMLNLSAIRSRNRKWKAFIASIALCVAGCVGMVATSILKDKALTSSYEHYIDTAKTSVGAENFNGFVENIQLALELDPTRYEAYDALIGRVEADGKLDKQTEWSAIYSSLNAYGEGSNRTNQERLLSADKEKYADIQYRIGKLLFLMTDGSTDNLSEAAAYFDKALNAGGMANSKDPALMQRAYLAQCLSTIGNNIESLASGSVSFVESEYDFAPMWKDLKSIIDNFSISSLGDHKYGIALYNRVAAMIQQYYYDFMNNGVQKQEISSLLTTIKTALTDTKTQLQTGTSSTTIIDMIDEALQTVDAAERKIGAMGGTD